MLVWCNTYPADTKEWRNSRPGQGEPCSDRSPGIELSPPAAGRPVAGHSVVGQAARQLHAINGHRVATIVTEVLRLKR